MFDADAPKQIDELNFFRDQTIVICDDGEMISVGAKSIDGQPMTLEMFRDVYFNAMLGSQIVREVDDD